METSVRNIVSSHLNAIKDGIALRMEQMGRNASGSTVRSMVVNTSDSGGTLEGSKSFMYLEHGRGPGKVPKGFYEIIKDWVIAKGISYQDMIPKNGTPEQGLARLSGAIAHSIITKGTRLYRDNEYNDIYSSLIEHEVELLSKEAAGIFETEVEKLQEIELDNDKEE